MVRPRFTIFRRSIFYMGRLLGLAFGLGSGCVSIFTTEWATIPF